MTETARLRNRIAELEKEVARLKSLVKQERKAVEYKPTGHLETTGK